MTHEQKQELKALLRESEACAFVFYGDPRAHPDGHITRLNDGTELMVSGSPDAVAKLKRDLKWQGFL